MNFKKGDNMKNLILAALLAIALPSFGFEVKNSAGATVGNASKVQCGVNLKCAVSGGVATITPNPHVEASTTALTKAQCGSTVYNSGAVVQPLPAVSTVGVGCRYTFVVHNVSNFDVNPDTGDIIQLLTNAAGDAIRADAIGESVVLESLSVSEWVPVGAEKGTWSDVN